MRRLLFFPFFFFAFSSCDPASDQTGCEDDSDCRFGRQCIQNVCLGDVDLTATNGRTNNGNTNNANNGSDNNDDPCFEECRSFPSGSSLGIGDLSCDCSIGQTNNGQTINNFTSSSNNNTVSSCQDFEDCGPDDVCVHPECGSNPISDACTEGICATPSNATLITENFTDSTCDFEWEIEQDSDALMVCFERNINSYGCTCFIDGIIRNTIRFSENPCDDLQGIEQKLNTFCGTKIRGTFEP